MKALVPLVVAIAAPLVCHYFIPGFWVASFVAGLVSGLTGATYALLVGQGFEQALVVLVVLGPAVFGVSTVVGVPFNGDWNRRRANHYANESLAMRSMRSVMLAVVLLAFGLFTAIYWKTGENFKALLGGYLAIAAGAFLLWSAWRDHHTKSNAGPSK